MQTPALRYRFDIGTGGTIPALKQSWWIVMLRVGFEGSSMAQGAAPTHFVVGQDRQGQWLALETHNRGGGLFKSRDDALHFADAQTHHRPGAVELASAPLLLRF